MKYARAKDIKAGHSRIKPSLILCLAWVLFVPLFAFQSIGEFEFWLWMSANLVFLLLLSFASDKSYFRIIRQDFRSGLGGKILISVTSALLLYGVFFLGNIFLRQFFPFAGEGIEGIYRFKEGASGVRIGLLMLFVIGPGEELFWRGYLQRHWEARLGPVKGWLGAAALYALVHIGSLNPVLVLAAGLCGLFWGALFLRYRSVLLIALSHTLWDILIFLVLPLSNIT